MLTALLLLPLAQAGAPRVVGGHVALPDEWPDVAAIVFNDNPSDVECSGVLIAPDLVLTAGHCAGGITGVILDTVDYTGGGESIGVAQTIEYPDSWGNYDVSLLILDHAATTTPRTIATGCVRDKYLADGKAVTIVGYGAVDVNGTRYTTELHEAYTTITDADCSDLDKGCFPNVSPGGELGAGGGGIDACFGDSGGPLYLNTPDGDFLVGTTSRAYDNVDQPCAEGGIYVRPDAIVDWIEEQSGETLPEPVCDAVPGPNQAPTATADPITAYAGASGYTRIYVQDESWQLHTFALSRDPSLGTVEVGENTGQVRYTAGEVGGDDDFDVLVTDDDPSNPLSYTLTIHATVIAPEPPADTGDTGDTGDTATDTGGSSKGCGCDGTGGAAGSLAWLGLLALALRRRRR